MTGYTPDQQEMLLKVARRGIEEKDVDMVKLALEKGADPSRIVASMSGDFFELAVKNNLLSLALQQGALPGVILIRALRFGSLDGVKTAVEEGKQDLRVKIDGDYPLHHCYSGANAYNLYDYLIAQDADVNAQNLSGETVLMKALKEGKKITAEYLLSLGANPMIADNSGDYPVAYVENYRHADSFRPNPYPDNIKQSLLKKMLDAMPAIGKTADFNAAAETAREIAAVKTPAFKNAPSTGSRVLKF